MENTNKDKPEEPTTSNAGTGAAGKNAASGETGKNTGTGDAVKNAVPGAAAKNTAKNAGKNGGGGFHNPQWRHIFMLILSASIIGIILFTSFKWGKELFDVDSSTRSGATYLIPYFTNLAGVLLFIMNTSRKKRKQWKLRNYWGDHCYRVAQSFAYLFIVLWAWNAVRKGSAVGANFPPNILGFLVGLFILRVERAMEGLGDKFEEALMSILPRATQYVSAEERRRQQLKMVYKVDDIATQYGVLRSQLDDQAARDRFDTLLNEAQSAVEGEDPDKLKSTVDRLSHEFDDVKKSAGEVLVPIEDLLANPGKGKTSGD